MRGLKAKTVLITGAAGGIGRALCARFLQEGARVFAVDINAEGLAELQAHAGTQGQSIFSEVVNIAEFGAVQACVDQFEKRHGPIDVLVNNAGWDRVGNFMDGDESVRRQVVEINLLGPINVTRAVLDRMVARNAPGKVVTIASDAGRVGSSGQAVYSACKGGMIALSKTLAREMARSNILFNVVCPGPTRTPMIADMLAGEGGRKIVEAMVKAIPLKRLGEPEDLPGIVAFLASDDANFITGQVISVSGGLTMHG